MCTEHQDCECQGRFVDLDTFMEFDHAIQVHPEGTITDAPQDIHLPELRDGVLSQAAAEAGWTLMAGYSNQQGHSGPLMHASEHIGGGLAEDIRTRPGLYIALVNYPIDGGELDEWAIAHKETKIAMENPTLGTPPFAWPSELPEEIAKIDTRLADLTAGWDPAIRRLDAPISGNVGTKVQDIGQRLSLVLADLVRNPALSAPLHDELNTAYLTLSTATIGNAYAPEHRACIALFDLLAPSLALVQRAVLTAARPQPVRSDPTARSFSVAFDHRGAATVSGATSRERLLVEPGWEEYPVEINVSSQWPSMYVYSVTEAAEYVHAHGGIYTEHTDSLVRVRWFLPDEPRLAFADLADVLRYAENTW